MSHLTFLFMVCGSICERGDLLQLIAFEMLSIWELWQIEGKGKKKAKLAVNRVF